MSLATVQDALVAVLRTSSHFNANNCRKDDPAVLGGRNDHACIVRYSGGRLEAVASPNRWLMTWTIQCDLWFRSNGRFARYNEKVELLVQDIYETVLAHPTLDNALNVVRVEPLDQGEPDRWVGELRGWWTVSIPFAISETNLITVLE